jgi:hypothetical protein
MSYDQSGFKEAKRLSDPLAPAMSFQEEFLVLLDWGFQDMASGNCSSFQIFNDQGEMIFSHSKNLQREKSA